MRSALAFVLVLTTVRGAGAVEIQKSGPQEFPSKHEISANLGYQAGYGGLIGNPNGFKLTADYAYKFHPIVWFDLRVAEVFGFDASTGPCTVNPNGVTGCYYTGGWATELAGGVKLKFRTSIPLVVEVPLLIGVDIMYGREYGDTGAAIAVHPGVGVKYFLTNRIGLGAQISTAFGPGFHGSSPAHGSYTDFYGYFDFLAGAEFVL
jgi:hypothetical protein